MAEQHESGEEVATKTFWYTMITAVIFIAVVFIFILPNHSLL
jgi:hypothetical protein